MRTGQMSNYSVDHAVYTDEVEIDNDEIEFVTCLDSDILTAVAKHMTEDAECCIKYYNTVNL